MRKPYEDPVRNLAGNTKVQGVADGEDDAVWRSGESCAVVSKKSPIKIW